jgi:lipoprotein-anchoring transpeptidase ErfK/SrfK
MKSAIVALITLVSVIAQADTAGPRRLPISPGIPRPGAERPPVPVQKSSLDNPFAQFFLALQQLSEPKFDTTPVDPRMEAQRQQDIQAARATHNEAQFMTADEIAEQLAEEGGWNAADADEDIAIDPSLLIEPVNITGDSLSIDVNISTQRLTMQGSRTPLFSEVISTGKSGHGTVQGVFHPIRLALMWHSKKYDNSPMPYSVFFQKAGYALHETPFVKQLGRKASHGCVRQNHAGAEYVFNTVSWYVNHAGRTSVTIVVHD